MELLILCASVTTKLAVMSGLPSETPCAACEPGGRRRVLNIEGLPHSNPLEAFDDMLTEFADDIVKATAPARDLLLPGKPQPAVRKSKIAEVLFRTPEAAERARCMIAGRAARVGGEYGVYLSDA